MNVPVQRAPSTPAMMYRAIVGIGTMCALMIVGVYLSTAERIAANEARALREAVSAVLPSAESIRSIAILPNGEIADVDASQQALPAFIGYDASGEIAGAAITAAGMGYQDTIKVIYAYSYRDSAIVGMRVLASLETPGLGDKIEFDPDFVANFERLDVSLAGGELANPVVTVPNGEKKHPWQIDAITGATVSSVAIGDLLNISTQEWVPKLVANRDKLAHAPEPEPEPEPEPVEE